MRTRSQSDALILLDHVHLSGRYPYLYVDTPKTGCSSIKKTLNLAECDGIGTLLSDKKQDTFGYSKGLMNVHDRTLMPLRAPESIEEFQAEVASRPVRFCFIRNPFTRVLSAYIDKIQANPQRRALFLQGLADPADRHKPISFFDFLRMLSRQAVAQMNPHWRTQVGQTMWSLIDYTHVGAFERFDMDLKRILSDIDPALLAFISTASEHVTGATERLMSYYSAPEIRALVLEIYGEDFDNFGYSTRIEDALEPPALRGLSAAGRAVSNDGEATREHDGDYQMSESMSAFQCNICGGTTSSESVSRADDVEVVYCDHCGMGVIQHIPDDLSVFYDNDYYGSCENRRNDVGYADYDYMAEHGVAWAAALVASLGLVGRILDVGCADGHLLKKLAANFSLFGIEVNAGAAKKAAEAGIEIVASDLLDDHLVENFEHSFDVVTSIATFEHLADFRGGVERVFQLLKEDGILLFEVPLISTRFDNKIWYTSSFEHVYYPTEYALRYLFDEEIKVPMVGTELVIKNYGCTYIGLASPNASRLQQLTPIWDRITGRANGDLTPDERGARVLLHLSHAATVGPQYLNDVQFLRPEYVTLETLIRIVTLMNARIYALTTEASTGAERRRQSEASDGEREARLKALESQLGESQELIRGLERNLVEANEASSWHATQSRRWEDEYHAIAAAYDQLQDHVRVSADQEEEPRRQTLISQPDEVRKRIEELEKALADVTEASAWHAAQSKRWEEEYHAIAAAYNQAQEELRVATEALTWSKEQARRWENKHHAFAMVSEQPLERVQSTRNDRSALSELQESKARIDALESALEDVNEASAWHADQAKRWENEYHKTIAVYERALELGRIARGAQTADEQPAGEAPVPQGRNWRWIAANPLLATKLAVLARVDRLSAHSPKTSKALRNALKRTWWLVTFNWGRKIEDETLLPDQGASSANHEAPEKAQAAVPDNQQSERPPVREIGVDLHAEDAPLVSIVIPCFNYGRFVADAVSSAAAQTFKNIEIIVVEGGSTDEITREIVQTLSGPKLRVFLRDEPHRVGDNRNFGISHARGKYICCLDADDRLHPTYVEKAVYMLERHGYDVISASVQMFGEKDVRYGVSEDVDLELLMQANHISTCALFRRDLWEEAGGFRDYGDGTPATHLHEDWGFWMRLAALGARITNFSRDYLFYYRVHGEQSLSRRPDIIPMEKQGEALRQANSDLLTKDAVLRSKQRRFARVEVQDGLANLAPGDWRPNPKSVLIALPFTVLGGAERLLSGVVRHLVEQGWEVCITKSIEAGNAAGDTTEWFEASTTQIYDLPKFLARPQWGEFVEYLIRAKRVSKVWIIGSEFVYHLLPELKEKFPSLLCVDLLFNTVGHTTNNRRYAASIDKILVENSEVKNWLAERGEDLSRVSTIASGVNLTELQPREKSAALLQALAIKPSGLLIGFSGRWSEEKDPVGFVQIAARLVKLVPMGNLYFVMTGTGPLKQAIIKELSTRPELNDRYHIMQNVPDVREVISSFDVIVLPSRLDGRPVVVLEALACGVPVVASRVGALPEIVEPGKTGALCDPGDYDGFARTLARLNDDRKLLTQMKKNARAFAEEHLDEQHMLERYEHALTTVEPRSVGALKNAGAAE